MCTKFKSDGDLRSGWLLVICAICSICVPGYFFTYTVNVYEGALANLPRILSLVAILALFVFVIVNRFPLRFENLVPSIFFLFMFLGIWWRFGFLGDKFPGLLGMLMSVYAFLILSIDNASRFTLLKYISYAFVLLMLPGLIYFLLKLIGVAVPYIEASSTSNLKASVGIKYAVFPFGVSRMVGGAGDYSGLYDEAGCLGTFAALILVAIDFNVRRNKFNGLKICRVLLLIEAVSTFSFAAILILGLYLILSLIAFNNTRYLFVVGVFVVLIVVIANIPLDNYMLVRLQERLQDLFSGVFSNNRMSQGALEVLDNYYNSKDAVIWLFGFGSESFQVAIRESNLDANSVMIYLYNFGIIGFAAYYFVLIVLYFYKAPVKLIDFIPLIIFLISTYQRPAVFTVLYFSILLLSNPVRCSDRLCEKRCSVRICNYERPLTRQNNANI